MKHFGNLVLQTHHDDDSDRPTGWLLQHNNNRHSPLYRVNAVVVRGLVEHVVGDFILPTSPTKPPLSPHNVDGMRRPNDGLLNVWLVVGCWSSFCVAFGSTRWLGTPFVTCGLNGAMEDTTVVVFPFVLSEE